MRISNRDPTLITTASLLINSSTIFSALGIFSLSKPVARQSIRNTAMKTPQQPPKIKKKSRNCNGTASVEWLWISDTISLTDEGTRKAAG